MNRVLLISGIAVFVAVTFLIINTQNTAIVYGCVKSSGKPNSLFLRVNRASGNLTKSALTSSYQNSIKAVLLDTTLPSFGFPLNNGSYSLKKDTVGPCR